MVEPSCASGYRRRQTTTIQPETAVGRQRILDAPEDVKWDDEENSKR
jgi:hypothetical protein